MRVGTARKGFTEKVAFEFSIKAGKHSERRKSGWVFNIKVAGLQSDQSIQVLERRARVRRDIKKSESEVEGIGAPACWLARNAEVLQRGRAVVMVTHFFSKYRFSFLFSPIDQGLVPVRKQPFTYLSLLFQISLMHTQTIYKHSSYLWKHEMHVRNFTL